MRTPGAEDDYFMPAIMGGGVAAFDADGDGDLDLFLVNGRGASNRLFRQVSPATFVDATAGSGLGLTPADAGMGCVAGDVDGDGDQDLYVTNRGPDRLYRNEGDGRFVDVSAEAGIDAPDWGASAAFFDFDRDGHLDLYVTNYIAWDESKICLDEVGQPDFCGPDDPGVPDRLYRNRGDGTFEDVSAAAGIVSIAGPGLGVACVDFDGDGWVDIYVANDKAANQLWINQGDGTFVDDAIILGVAFNGSGAAEAGMGVTAGDADGDGDPDLFVTHLSTETNTFYRNAGGMAFDDATGAAGLGVASTPYTGWGTAFFDADLDGDLDLAVANGGVQRRASVVPGADFWAAYAEPNHFFVNDGRGRFALDARGTALPGASDERVSRGLLVADLDADGDQDLVITNLGATVEILRNDTPARAHLAIDAVEPRPLGPARVALGARLEITAGSTTWVRSIMPPGGYLTHGPATVYQGLSEESAADSVLVHWPDGTQERFAGPLAGRITLRRGEGSTP